MPPFDVPLFLVLLLLPPLLWLFLKAQARKSLPKLPPGPRPLPIIGNLHMLGQNPHRALTKLAQKYGPIMFLRLGHVPTIVVSSPRAAELFLKRHDVIFASRPLLLVWDHMVYGAKDIALTPYGEYWRHVRKMFTLHLLSPAKVAGFEGLRRAEIEVAVRQLVRAAAAREVVDVGKSVGEAIEGIVFKMVVGRGKEDDKRYDLKNVIQEASILGGAFNLADFIPFLAPFDLQGITRQVKALRKVTDEMFENIIEDHLREDDFGQNRDILGMLLSLMHSPTDEFSSSFGKDNVKALMFDFFAGGIETTQVTVTWVFSGLLKHPRVMKLVQAELDNIVGRERMVVESDLSKLIYLDMVIKETFRLYPTAPLLIPHESMEDVVVDGYMIPKKSRVLINFWAIGRDTNEWSDNVEEFCPERFMDRDIDVRGQHFALSPFGAGRRMCPGIQLGLITVKLIVAQLIHCFDWELPNGMHAEDLDMTEKFGLTRPRANKLLAIPCYRLRVTR